MTDRKTDWFPLLCSGIFATLCIYYAATDTQRALPAMQETYFYLKWACAILGFGFCGYFYFFESNDFALGLLMVMFAVYTVSHMWLMPLYENAFLQTAIASSFFNMRRRWIFPVVFGACLAAMIYTYHLQDLWGWRIPEATRKDWIASIVIFFLAAWFIQLFALGTYRREQERLSRFSIIGAEATRLIHDIKGLLSSPLLIVDSLRSGRKISNEEFESQMVYLARDMENVREMIKSIHRLVRIEEVESEVDIAEAARSSARLLERRMQHVHIQMPEARKIVTSGDRLHSVFFNLFLNSLEAFEDSKVKDARIDMHWEGNILYFVDNAGGLDNRRAQKAHGSGLGLALAKADLAKMGARLSLASSATSTTIRIRFSKLRPNKEKPVV